MTPYVFIHSLSLHLGHFKEGLLQRASAIKYPDSGQLATYGLFPGDPILGEGADLSLTPPPPPAALCHENIALVRYGIPFNPKNVLHQTDPGMCLFQELVGGSCHSGRNIQKVWPPLHLPSPTPWPHTGFFPTVTQFSYTQSLAIRFNFLFI